MYAQLYNYIFIKFVDFVDQVVSMQFGIYIPFLSYGIYSIYLNVNVNPLAWHFNLKEKNLC